MNYKVKTYEETIKVIEEVGLLPLATMIPDYPSLNSITAPESWHTDTEYDPWAWRTKFSADGVAGYGKFIKKKAVFVSRQLLPYVKNILGSPESIEARYFQGLVSREAYRLYEIISQEPGIDTRALRTKAELREKEQKKLFENALIELQGSMDIVISGLQEKMNADGEKNGWSSTAFETYDSWAARNNIERVTVDKDESKTALRSHFETLCSQESLKKLEKLLIG